MKKIDDREAEKYYPNKFIVSLAKNPACQSNGLKYVSDWIIFINNRALHSKQL
jgi:hypothetical protein